MKILLIIVALLCEIAKCRPPNNSPEVLYEGDLALTELQAYIQYSDNLGRKTVLELRNRWPNALVKYRIHPSAEWYKASIERAIRNIRNHTCINFIETHDEKDLPQLLFKDEGRCYSYVGKVFDDSPQTLSMSSLCTDVPLYMVHEICHALGMYHEHRRPDRDDYIRVFEENIDDKYLYTFSINENMETFGIPYDVTSVMHYYSSAFSKNGGPVMLPRDLSLEPYMGFSSTLRFGDMKALHLLYECNIDHCPDSRQGFPSCPPEGFRDPMCNCICPHDTKAKKCPLAKKTEPCCDIVFPLIS